MLTDYPDPELIRNLEKNVQTNLCGDAIKNTHVEAGDVPDHAVICS